MYERTRVGSSGSDDRMAYEIAHAEQFPFDLGRSPKSVRNAYTRWVCKVLSENPEDHESDARLKKLKGFKQLWRCRVSDSHRLVYAVDRGRRLVTMLMLGPRSDIYERLGSAPGIGPGYRIVANDPSLLEPAPTAEEVGKAILAMQGRDDHARGGDRRLPVSLTADLLRSWSVAEGFDELLGLATTEGEILALSERIPRDVLERVINGIFPRKIEEIVQSPVRLSPNPTMVEEAATGQRSLSSFLLQLDDRQKPFVDRFTKPDPKGPWLLKGGPGSGKSTVALYCLDRLVKTASENLLQTKSLKILFTTYTKSLVKASEDLLTELGVGRYGASLRTVHPDRLVREHLQASGSELLNLELVTKDYQWKAPAVTAMEMCAKADPRFGFSGPEDAAFLYTEVDSVVYGQGITTEEGYLKADRAGRGRRLSVQQRSQVWLFCKTFRKNMRSSGFCTFSELASKAARTVAASYDYVFIDEAQDLNPATIRFCVGLCKEPSKVFLTADTNQSIYGSGLSWSAVSAELRFTGRATTLTKNHRTTVDIWRAIEQLTPTSEGTDKDTLDLDGAVIGSPPLLVFHRLMAPPWSRLDAFLRESLIAERVGPDCAAVLCWSRDEAEEVANCLDPGLNAKAMRSGDLDLRHPGLKVLTIHAAKGLQFPVVAVVGVRRRETPLDQDPDEHQARSERLLFVACTRAMRRLAVFGGSPKAPLLSRVTDERWVIEEA